MLKPSWFAFLDTWCVVSFVATIDDEGLLLFVAQFVDVFVFFLLTKDEGDFLGIFSLINTI